MLWQCPIWMLSGIGGLWLWWATTLTLSMSEVPDNKVTDALSCVGGHLDKDMVKELLSHATHYGIPLAEADDPWVVQGHDWAEGEIIMQAWVLAQTKKNYKNLADSHWVVTQQGDLVICLVTQWLKRRKDNHRTLDKYLKHQVPDAECWIYVACQKDFLLWRNLLYLRTMPKRSNEDVLVFMVPGLKCQAAIDRCHHYLGHQGRDHTLNLLRERFWWPGMAQRMIMSVCNCDKCCIFEAKPQIPPMEPIICSEPLDLVHIDFVSMEVMVGIKEKPVMKNILVIEDHFTRYTKKPLGMHYSACFVQWVLLSVWIPTLSNVWPG